MINPFEASESAPWLGAAQLHCPNKRKNLRPAGIAKMTQVTGLTEIAQPYAVIFKVEARGVITRLPDWLATMA